MVKIYKITFVAVSVVIMGIIYSMCFGNDGILPLGLLFVLPVLWILWIFSVFSKDKGVAFKSIGLWILIDIAVLGVTHLLTSHVPRGGRSGYDAVFLIAFSPLIWPEIFVSAISPMIGSGLAAICRGATHLLVPDRLKSVLDSWLGFSIWAAISSYLFVQICRLWRWIYRNDER